MGRIRHTTLAFGLHSTGYWIRATAFDAERAIRQVEVNEMSWRELSQMLEDMVDLWRPGIELLEGASQLPLFD